MKNSLVIGLLMISLSVLFPFNGKTAIKDSVVLYFPLDEAKDEVVFDESGKGNNGVINGEAKWVAGKSGSALEFNGVDSFIEVPHSDSLNLVKELTVAFWVKVYEMIQYGGIIDKWEQSGNFKGYLIQSSTTYPVGMLLGSGAEYKAVRMEDAPLNIWLHVAMTYDGNAMTAYLDGEVYGQETIIMSPAADGPMFIGKRTHGANAFFKGIIDELAIFNKALKADEIESIMRGTFMAVEPSSKSTVKWGALKYGL